MKIFAEVELTHGGRILRVERRIDHRGLPFARLHVIGQNRRGPTEGAIYWLTPNSLPEIIDNLTRAGADPVFEMADIRLNERGKLLRIRRRTEGASVYALLQIEPMTLRNSTEASAIVIPAASVGNVVGALRRVAASFGLGG